MKIKKVQEKGITLVALIITIIIMLILAAVVLNVTIGENGIFKIAKQATQKYRIEEIREKIEIEIANIIAKETSLGNDITIEKVLQELLENETFESIDKESGIGYIDEYEVKLKENEDGSIVIEYIQKATGLRITYLLEPKGYTNEEKVSILFKVQGKVKSVTKPDKSVEYPKNNPQEINYQVDKNGTYQFIVESEEGITITKDVIVDTIDKLPPEEFTITASQVNNKLVITANAEDAEATQDSAKSGIEKYEYYVKKSTDTNYPETPYTTNEIEGLEYDTYTVYAKVYDKAGNSKTSSNEVTIQIMNSKISKYGQTVNYSANGVEDWKVFYINEDRNETFIITSGYLPVGKVPKSATGMYTAGTYGASWKTVPTYKEITEEVRDRYMMSWNNNTTTANIKCVSRLLDTDAWSGFIADELKDKGVTAIGSPTLEMFIASWNDLYPNKKIEYYGINSYGYMLEKDETRVIDLSYGADNTLYFPYKNTINSCSGYYLSSPSSSSSRKGENIISILSTSQQQLTRENYWQNMYRSIRPIVCIPSDLLEYDETTSLWNIK